MDFLWHSSTRHCCLSLQKAENVRNDNGGTLKKRKPSSWTRADGYLNTQRNKIQISVPLLYSRQYICMYIIYPAVPGLNGWRFQVIFSQRNDKGSLCAVVDSQIDSTRWHLSMLSCKNGRHVSERQKSLLYPCSLCRLSSLNNPPKSDPRLQSRMQRLK